MVDFYTHAYHTRPATAPVNIPTRTSRATCLLADQQLNTLSSLAEGRAYGVRVRWKIRGITEFKPSRNGSDQTIRTSFSANFAPGAWHLLPSPLAPGISCATAARHPSDPSACESRPTRRRLQMEPGEGHGRGAGVGGLVLNSAATVADEGATWRRRATATAWQDQVAPIRTASEGDHHWEAGDVSECILLFGAFCNGEKGEAMRCRVGSVRTP